MRFLPGVRVSFFGRMAFTLSFSPTLFNLKKLASATESGVNRVTPCLLKIDCTITSNQE
jgi:hypothetical protein